jgi:hypothetical protein
MQVNLFHRFSVADNAWFRMGPEANIELIRDLEKQIKEGSGDVIKLKRTRNSFLNISTRVPPEILGKIFFWIVARKRDFSPFASTTFDGLENGSYNFLLVCHHWFEVASNTPELWGFWGDSLQGWNALCHHTAAAPVDLVLSGPLICSGAVVSVPLRDALRDCAIQDKIREIHLMSNEIDLLDSIFSSLTPNGEDLQEKRRVESIALLSKIIPSGFSKFFTRSRLPNLQNLRIEGELQLPLWDHLVSQTTGLTDLDLGFTHPSPLPSPSQLLSILASNPNLQYLALSDAALPNAVDGFDVKVPLRNLRSIYLAECARNICWLLDRLELPAALDLTAFRISPGFTAQDILQTLGPRIRDHLQRDPRFQHRLGVDLAPGRIDIHAGHVGSHHMELFQCPLVSSHKRFGAFFAGPYDPMMEKSTLDLMAFIPREHVVHLELSDPMEVPNDLLAGMPNIETLWLDEHPSSYGFLRPNSDGLWGNAELLPSLRFLHTTKQSP